MSLDSAIQHLLAAKRISAPSQSYAKDNPGEWAKVQAYLTGGSRPAGVVTEMGLGLLEVEDERRGVEPPPPPPPPPPPTGRLWAADSPINTPIPANPQVIHGYGQGVFAGLPGVGLHTGGWNVGLFRNVSGAPRRSVYVRDNSMTMDGVPMPAQLDDYINWGYAIGEDERHCCVIDGDKVWNLYGLYNTLDSVYAGGAFRLAGSGFWNISGTGVWIGRASGFCSATGAITKAELDAGLIEHALTCCFPKDRISGPSWTVGAGSYAAPATASDGSGGSGGVKMGSRIQLDPTLSDAQLQGLGISATYLPVARALQRYGAYVADSSSLMRLYTVNWEDSGQVSFPGDWNGAGLVSRLRVVAPPAAPVYDSASTFGQPHS